MNTNVDMMSKPNNTWVNEFGDKIIIDEKHRTGIRSIDAKYQIIIHGKYFKTVGGLKVAKSVINKQRCLKCDWVGVRE